MTEILKQKKKKNFSDLVVGLYGYLRFVQETGFEEISTRALYIVFWGSLCVTMVRPTGWNCCWLLFQAGILPPKAMKLEISGIIVPIYKISTNWSDFSWLILSMSGEIVGWISSWYFQLPCLHSMSILAWLLVSFFCGFFRKMKIGSFQAWKLQLECPNRLCSSSPFLAT
jgi:hypothetical protein